ncbi:HEAT repeat domain-containing protein [Luteitalea sp.]|jgi:HEAT repeat protein|uniref:HEAT repeat domain-containing protein n=1 Tax=Luteitalea sp. TaxID=2004800 RepID=UPI0037CA8CD5
MTACRPRLAGRALAVVLACAAPVVVRAQAPARPLSQPAPTPAPPATPATRPASQKPPTPAAPAATRAAGPAEAATLSQAIDRLGKLDYKTRVEASAALRRAPAATVVPLLTEAARRHADGYVRFRALVLLSGFNDPGSAPVFLEALGDENDRLREVAYAWVEDHPQPTLVPRLLEALEREQAEFVRPALIRALAAHGSDVKVQAVLKREVMRGVDFFRSAVIEALGVHKATWALDEITKIALLDGPLQDDAVRAIGQIGDKRGLTTLATVQRSASRELQPTIAAAICGLGSNCDGHARFIRESLDYAAHNLGYQELARSSATALADLSALGRAEALPALFDLGMPANDPVRAPIALATGQAVMRNPGQLLGLVASLPRQPSTLLLRDAFDMLEEDYAEERFFAAVRRQYWASAADAPERAAAQVLITALEF